MHFETYLLARNKFIIHIEQGKYTQVHGQLSHNIDIVFLQLTLKEFFMTTKRIICKIKLFYRSLLDETCILKLAFFYNYHQIRNELKLIIKLINLECPYWFTMFCCIIISLISYLLYAQLCFSYILNCPHPHSQNEVYPKLLKKRFL